MKNTLIYVYITAKKAQKGHIENKKAIEMIIEKIKKLFP